MTKLFSLAVFLTSTVFLSSTGAIAQQVAFFNSCVAGQAPSSSTFVDNTTIPNGCTKLQGSSLWAKVTSCTAGTWTVALHNDAACSNQVAIDTGSSCICSAIQGGALVSVACDGQGADACSAPATTGPPSTPTTGLSPTTTNTGSPATTGLPTAGGATTGAGLPEVATFRCAGVGGAPDRTEFINNTVGGSGCVKLPGYVDRWGKFTCDAYSLTGSFVVAIHDNAECSNQVSGTGGTSCICAGVWNVSAACGGQGESSCDAAVTTGPSSTAGSSTGSIISTTAVGTTGAPVNTTEAPSCVPPFTNPVAGDSLLPSEGCVAISLDNTAAYVFGGTKLALLQQTLLKIDLATGAVAAVTTTGSPADTYIYNDCEAFIVDESGTETLYITSQGGGWKLDTSALAWSFVGIGKKGTSNLLFERAAAAMNRVYWYVANGVGLFRSTDGQLGSLGAPFPAYDTLMHFSGTKSGALIIYGGMTQTLPTQNMWKGVLAGDGTTATWTLLSSSTPVTAAFDPLRVRFAHVFQDMFASFHLGSSSSVAFVNFDMLNSTWSGLSTSLRGPLPTFVPVLASTDRTFLVD
jgi:hypothetical protein